MRAKIGYQAAILGAWLALAVGYIAVTAHFTAHSRVLTMAATAGFCLLDWLCLSPLYHARTRRYLREQTELPPTSGSVWWRYGRILRLRLLTVLWNLLGLLFLYLPVAFLRAVAAHAARIGAAEAFFNTPWLPVSLLLSVMAFLFTLIALPTWMLWSLCIAPAPAALALNPERGALFAFATALYHTRGKRFQLLRQALQFAPWGLLCMLLVPIVWIPTRYHTARMTLFCTCLQDVSPEIKTTTCEVT